MLRVQNTVFRTASINWSYVFGMMGVVLLFRFWSARANPFSPVLDGKL